MKIRPCLHDPMQPETCPACNLVATDDRYAHLRGALSETSPRRMAERSRCIHLGEKIPGQPCGSQLYQCGYDNTVCSTVKPCTEAARCCQSCDHFQKLVQVDPIKMADAKPSYRRFRDLGDGPAVYAHSGDSGDIIYSLHAVHDLQAELGRRAEFCLYPVRGTRVRMDPKHAANIIPLLEVQPYLSRAFWSAHPVGIRLDRMARKFWSNQAKNLQDHYAHALTIDRAHQQGDWLTVPDPKPIAEIVLARSKRYRGAFPWQRVLAVVRGKCVFVGTSDEHADFERIVGKVPHYPTANLLSLAQVIAGAKLFVGNQSCPRAIAEGLKKPVVVETGAPDDTRFDRSNAWYSGGKHDFWCEVLEAYARDQQEHSTPVSRQPIRHAVLRGPGG